MRGSYSEVCSRVRDRRTPPSKLQSCEKNHLNSFLKIERRAVSWRHEARKYLQQATVDPPREPAANELACRGCREVHRRRPSGAGDLGAGRAIGFEPVLRGHRE